MGTLLGLFGIVSVIGFVFLWALCWLGAEADRADEEYNYLYEDEDYE